MLTKAYERHEWIQSPDFDEPAKQYKRTPVSLTEALQLCRAVEEIAVRNGYHTALTGGVLYRGDSKKDVDIILYPHQVKNGSHSKESFMRAHSLLGATEIYQTDSQYLDKDVVLCTIAGKRVDLFFLT